MSPLLMFLQVVRGTGMLLGAIMAILYVVLIIKLFQLLGEDNIEFKDVWFFLFMSFYGIAFSVLLVLVEYRLVKAIDIFLSMGEWWVRGLFMFFKGLLALSVLTIVADGNDTLENFVEIISYIIMSIGCLYVLMELLGLRNKAKADVKVTKSFPNIV